MKKLSDHQACYQVMSSKILNMLFRVGVAQSLTTETGYQENDLSSLTVEEIVEKIREFVKSNDSLENCDVFLRYLACYPVSLCKRDVSKTLAFLIGFHYRLGEPNGFGGDRVSRITYDELAQIFGRSKATISQYVNETQKHWDIFQEAMKQEKLKEELKQAFKEQAKEIALKQLIEEEKAKLRSNPEQLKQLIKNEQTVKPLS